MRTGLSLAAALAVAACSLESTQDQLLPDLPEGVQAISLLGDTLVPIPPDEETRLQQLEDLGAALRNYEANPDDAEAIIWLGRRHAYLGEYRKAVQVYTEGIEKHPDDARMYRHRGHRFITLRLFDRAVADLERAATLQEGKPDEVEPDGQPNERGIPTSTLQFNIYYHLGLAHYLQGDFEQAFAAYQVCAERSDIPDRMVATAHWHYMTLRRLGREEEAAEVLHPITADLDVIENHSYHRLLLMYKGELTADDLMGPEQDAVQSATVAYGVGNWHHYNGRGSEATTIFRNILTGTGWAAFGFLGAEAEVARGEK